VGSKQKHWKATRRAKTVCHEERLDVCQDARVTSSPPRKSNADAVARHAKRVMESRGLTRNELFFGVTLFLSAALLFAVQPMFAKMALPLLGGAPAVWNTCLVFYQAILLAGYLYAHLSLKWLGARRQAKLHLVLLLLPWAVLPIGVAQDWVPPSDVFPVYWLWMLLSISVGLPFFLISATSPMLQAWFNETDGQTGHDPYFLYAASNLGSLLALLSYPLLIESHLTLSTQSWTWAIGYGLLMAMLVGCAIQLWRSPVVNNANEPAAAIESPSQERPNWPRRLHWLALSFVPSSLLMGVTTYISTDLAPIPLFWVIPLSLYLLTFVFVFARRVVLPLSWMLRIQPYFLVAAAAALTGNVESPMQLLFLGSLQLAAFFVTAMVCHGQLADDRPAGRYLTEFYLWMSLGGVLGGLFNALIAPLTFTSTFEYPLMLALACILRPNTELPLHGLKAWMRELALPVAILLLCVGAVWAIDIQMAQADWQDSRILAGKMILLGTAMIAVFLLSFRPLWFGIGVATLLGISLCYPETRSRVIHAERSFFGVLRVRDNPKWNIHEFMHGSTCHGNQSLDEKERFEPTAYYNREGPLGHIFQALRHRQSQAEIGVLGLGVGTVAAYGLPGERITFYEIDPNVERIAKNPQYFTYLSDCRAKTEVVLGDARLSLVHGPSRQFDLLVLDVFSSDSVPVHLVTREAMQTYLQHLAKHGLLAVHISGRYLDLEPVLSKLAQDAHMSMRTCNDDRTQEGPKRYASTWVVMSRQADDLAEFEHDASWPLAKAGAGPVWTDDFSDVVSTFRLKNGS